MTAPAPVLSFAFNKENPGVYCQSHRSVYCAHVVEHIGERKDTEQIKALITEGLDTTSSDWTGTLTVPVYPNYCVWEKARYTAKGGDSPFGPHLEYKGGAKKIGTDSGGHLATMGRILEGDSLLDLSFAIRSSFEPIGMEILEDLLRNKRQSLPRCTSRTHSFTYQRVMDAVTKTDAIRSCVEDGDTSAQIAMLYCLVVHKECMLCYVNSNFREALRVNPEMEKFIKPDSETGFDDLAPDADSAKSGSSIWKSKTDMGDLPF